MALIPGMGSDQLVRIHRRKFVGGAIAKLLRPKVAANTAGVAGQPRRCPVTPILRSIPRPNHRDRRRLYIPVAVDRGENSEAFRPRSATVCRFSRPSARMFLLC